MIFHSQIEYGIQRRDFNIAAHYDCFCVPSAIAIVPPKLHIQSLIKNNR
jgi:hypothetical protein